MHTPTIPGLIYRPQFLSENRQHVLIEEIDKMPWLSDMRRRVQHYGYKYDYRKRIISSDAYLGPLPDWARALVERLRNETPFNGEPDQLIVNEYLPGQGIATHIDCVPCFGSVLASVSLGSTCIMDLTKLPAGLHHELLLEPGSLLVLEDEARYLWRHGIRARKSDRWQGQRLPRRRRLSLTFRSTLVQVARSA